MLRTTYPRAADGLRDFRDGAGEEDRVSEDAERTTCTQCVNHSGRSARCVTA